MSYAAVTDLELRLGKQTVIELTNPKQRSDSINVPVAEAAIADGTGIIDSYIGQRVSLPLAIVPALVKTLAIDLAVYYLKVKLGNTGKSDNATTKLYDDAIKHLERFAKGDTSLGLSIPDDDPTDDAPSHHADISSEDRQFTRTTMGRLT
ncbi:MAG: DUF1320 domain-containing protein [Psychrobacter sp.]|uniref:gp436 family protein n=1 Tax=Psychrobacter sp. TaxID=56811 RepID=UPI002648E4F6|nr:DUF1320 domain-containing protein [Psychrobacter sp.]MDN5619237.1 DUF1320 domain-containing protein [Psychrobacter sp.]